MSGPRPTPSHLKVLRGTGQPCRMNPEEPKPDIVHAVPPPPETLNADGKQAWNEIAKTLTDIGVLTVADLGMLEVLATQFGMFRKLRKEVYKNGMTDTDGKTTDEMKTLLQLGEALRKGKIEFGLTPASRTKVSGKKIDVKKSAWSDL